MWPSIILAAVALFSHIGGIHVQACEVFVPLGVEISSDNQWAFVTSWSKNDFECRVDVMTNASESVGHTTCKPSTQGLCTIPIEIRPECVDDEITKDEFYLATKCPDECKGANTEPFTWPTEITSCTDANRKYVGCDKPRHICPNGQNYTGPGCYCENEDEYLYQPENKCVDQSYPDCFPLPGITQSVNLFVQPCIEVARPLTITWNLDIPINKYEVRDYTGDFVVGDTVSSDALSVSFDAPPVGIYEVTVSWGTIAGSFNESARFFTVEENKIVEQAFRIRALPNANGATVCFSSDQKDVSYLCQEGSGDKTPCTHCASYWRANGTEKITIYLLGNGEVVNEQSFYYRV